MSYLTFAIDQHSGTMMSLDVPNDFLDTDISKEACDWLDDGTEKVLVLSG